jgi:hypothetical protein
MKVALNIIYSLGIPVSSTIKTDRHDVTEILLKVALNTINHQYHIICMQNIYYSNVVHRLKSSLQTINVLHHKLVDRYEISNISTGNGSVSS